jgi:hypothetical protein
MSEWGSVARGADRQARQHSAAWFGFKPNKKHSKWFKRIQNSPKFDFSKRCLPVLQNQK